MRLLLAVRVFFRILFDRPFAERIQNSLGSFEAAPTEAAAEPAARGPVRRPRRSDSLTLLAVLQREARFIDFVQESLEGYSDAQIGAAVRDVHRDCGTVLERLFGIVPVMTEHEGTEVEVIRGYDPGQWKLTGKVQGEPPFRGRLAHHGWKATKCELPEWSGAEASERIVAPVEVELRK